MARTNFRSKDWLKADQLNFLLDNIGTLASTMKTGSPEENRKEGKAFLWWLKNDDTYTTKSSRLADLGSFQANHARGSDGRWEMPNDWILDILVAKAYPTDLPLSGYTQRLFNEQVEDDHIQFFFSWLASLLHPSLHRTGQPRHDETAFLRWSKNHKTVPETLHSD